VTNKLIFKSNRKNSWGTTHLSWFGCGLFKEPATAKDRSVIDNAEVNFCSQFLRIPKRFKHLLMIFSVRSFLENWKIRYYSNILWDLRGYHFSVLYSPMEQADIYILRRPQFSTFMISTCQKVWGCS